MTLTEKLEEDLITKKSEDSLVSQSKIKRVIFYLAGTLFLFLGIIGLILPILPTTPFLLLSAACYVRSSEKAYNWLISNRIFGKVIQDYRAGMGLPFKVKAITIILLWMTILISLIFISILWVQVLLLLVASLVTIHVSLIHPKKSE